LYDDSFKKYNASIFDLISGDNETKQTKGLAYIFSQYNDFLFDFLEMKKIKSEIQSLVNDFNKNKIDAIEVSAEKISNTGNRADIVIKLFSKNIVLLAIVIEAKSINVKVNQDDLSSQIKDKYLNDNSFNDLENVKKIGIVLTKYRYMIPDIISITWDEIINLLNNYCKKNKSDNTLIYQYFNFLTNIGGSMKFYEKEVVSIPAGETIDLIEKHKVYSCRNSGIYAKIPPSLYVTFRRGNGGEMSKLYKLVDTIVFNPNDPNDVNRLKESNIETKIIKQIEGYLSDDKAWRDNTDCKFFILSFDNNIELPKKPKPKNGNNANIAYYTLSELLQNELV